MKKAKNPAPCNWVVQIPGVKPCGKPAVGTIHKAGYCKEHAQAAQRMFGKMVPIIKEDLFEK